MLQLATHTLKLIDEIELHAQRLVRTGVRPLDALHLAFASWTKSDYFGTCDDKLLRKCKRLKTLATKVVSPLELVEEISR